MRLPRLFFKLNRLAGLEGENTDMEGTSGNTERAERRE